MGTQLELRFDRDLPRDLAVRVVPQCHVAGPELSIFEIESIDLRAIAKHLEPLRESLVFGPYFVPDRDVELNSESVVGAVLAPDDVQGSANSPDEFEPAWPPPCGGIVKDGVAIRCHVKPKGHMAMIGDDFVYSKRVLQFIDFERFGQVSHAVTWKGSVLENWRGVRFEKECRVISSNCFGSAVPCTRCLSPYIPWRGVWISGGEIVEDFEIGREVLGGEHRGTRRPIVAAKQVALDLKKSLGKSGMLFEPIYRRDSVLGRQFELACNLFRTT